MLLRFARALIPVFLVTAGLLPVARLTSAADEAGTIQFSASAYSVAESAGSAAVTVTRTGGSTGVVSLTFSTSNGSAVSGSDYTAVSQTVTFTNGDTASKTVSVPILSDLMVEGDEAINLALTGPTGGASLGSPSASVLTIVDDDGASLAGTVQLSGATYSVGESAGSATITINRTGGSTGVASVLLTTSNGSATSGSDYTAVSQTVSFGAGDATSKTVSVPITADSTDEADETVMLTLSAPTGASLGSQSSATLTIVDDDGAGTLQFSAAAYSVGESGGSATITVTRTGGSTGAASATVTTSNGSATAGSDYTAVSQLVTFADGDAANKTVSVPVTSDLLDEIDETVNLTLSGVTGASMGSPFSAVLTIIDDDGTVSAVGTLQFSAAAYSLGESGGSATITVTRTGGSTGAASATVTTSNGSATSGSDYTAVSQLVTFADGDAANKTVSVPVTSDLLDEIDETVNLTLSGVTGASMGSPFSAVLTIIDDDGTVSAAGTLQFSAAAYSVGESGGSATITVTRTGGSTGAASATVTTSNGSATAGSDYTAVSQLVTFADGDAASKTVSVPVASDVLDEIDETVNLTLSGVTGASMGSPFSAVLTIIDDDGQVVDGPGDGGNGHGGTRPGWGCGDKNHVHTGPPGNPNAESPCKNHDSEGASANTNTNTGANSGSNANANANANNDNDRGKGHAKNEADGQNHGGGEGNGQRKGPKVDQANANGNNANVQEQPGRGKGRR